METVTLTHKEAQALIDMIDMSNGSDLYECCEDNGCCPHELAMKLKGERIE